MIINLISLVVSLVVQYYIRFNKIILKLLSQMEGLSKTQGIKLIKALLLIFRAIV